MIAKLEEQLDFIKNKKALLIEATKEKECGINIFKEFTAQIDADMVEIVDYCIKADISVPIYIPLATLDGEKYKDSLYKGCQIVFSYHPGYEKSWYLGFCGEINNRQRSVSFGVKNDIRHNKPYPKWKFPEWEQDGFILHTRAFFTDDISQYLYSNWPDLKETLIDKLCEKISEYYEDGLSQKDMFMNENLFCDEDIDYE